MKHYSIVTLTYLGQNLEIMEKCQEMKEKPLDSIGKSTGEGEKNMIECSILSMVASFYFEFKFGWLKFWQVNLYLMTVIFFYLW